MREKHVDFLKRGLLHLSSGFVALDARYCIPRPVNVRMQLL